MFLFWFLVVLSVYFEIFCYKICLETKKMWKICRKIAFSECYQTPEIVFRTIFHCKTKHPDFIFLTEIHFLLHSFYTRNSIYIEPNAAIVASPPSSSHWVTSLVDEDITLATGNDGSVASDSASWPVPAIWCSETSLYEWCWQFSGRRRLTNDRCQQFNGRRCHTCDRCWWFNDQRHALQLV